MLLVVARVTIPPGKYKVRKPRKRADTATKCKKQETFITKIEEIKDILYSKQCKAVTDSRSDCTVSGIISEFVRPIC